MVYEKKLLILTGSGSGVVTVEKSARGTSFALRTFGIDGGEGRKVGVITKHAVYVRDLPSVSDPSIVFQVEGDCSELHFAVFDTGLILYGTTAPARMWEANVMGLLHRYAEVGVRREELPALPPIASYESLGSSEIYTRKPALAGDGLYTRHENALPESSDAEKIVEAEKERTYAQTDSSAPTHVYGDGPDENGDFYSGIDIESRMPAVDSFLDEPRVLNASAVGKEADGEQEYAKTEAAASAEPTRDPPRERKKPVRTYHKPSALDGLSPRVAPPNVPAYMIFPPDIDDTVAVHAREREVSGERGTERATVAPDVVDLQTNPESAERGNDGQEGDGEGEKSESDEQDGINEITNETDKEDKTGKADVTDDAEKDGRTETVLLSGNERETTGVSDILPQADEASADADTATAPVGQTEEDVVPDGQMPPWERAARYLKARSGRKPTIEKKSVRAVKPKTEIKSIRETAFFERCRTDIEKLFAEAPKDEELAALLPDIEWVRVEFGGRRVGVGRGDNAFLCYAVAGTYEKTSPLGKEAQWLPKLKTAPTGKGFWLIFQDLISGKILEG